MFLFKAVMTVFFPWAFPQNSWNFPKIQRDLGWVEGGTWVLHPPPLFTGFKTLSKWFPTYELQFASLKLILWHTWLGYLLNSQSHQTIRGSSLCQLSLTGHSALQSCTGGHLTGPLRYMTQEYHLLRGGQAYTTIWGGYCCFLGSQLCRKRNNVIGL